MRKVKLLLWIVILSLVFASPAIAISGVSTQQYGPSTVISVDPPVTTVIVGGAFSIDISIADVADLSAWEFKLSYDTTLLDATYVSASPDTAVCTDWVPIDGGKWQPDGPPTIDEPAGVVWTGALFPSGSEFTGSGILVTIDFTATAAGDCTLHLFDTTLYDWMFMMIAHTTVDGSVTVTGIPVHDIAITDVRVSPTIVVAGESVSIDVDVLNEGDFDETFDVSVYYDSVLIGTDLGVTLLAGATTTLLFTWDTTGVVDGTYTITAEADVVLGETDVVDNVYIDGDVTVALPVHDIAIIDVRVSPTTVTVGDPVSIDVDVLNEGNVDETFDVNVYYDSVLIGTDLGVTLSAGASTTLPFTWDTTGVSEGTYTIKAEVPPVLGETDVVDNEFVDGTVTITAVPVHDIAITDVRVSPTSVIVGEFVSIEVDVLNEGNMDEGPFDVSVYYDSTLIDTATVVSLSAGATITIGFTWDTTGVADGIYTIKAEADVVPGETDVVDNVYIDGDVTVALPVHDIAVTDVRVSPTSVVAGESVSIDVDVLNEGDVDETFDVNVYYDLTLIDTTSVTLLAGAGTTLSFTWDTTGVGEGTYTIRAEVPLVPGETDIADNEFVDGDVTITAPVHDIAITDVRVSPTSVIVGEFVSIEVDVLNEGNVDEGPFDVNVYYDSVLIDTATVVSISAGATTTISFTWDTTSVSEGTYTIWAEVPPVAGETDTVDNVYIDGDVTVALPVHDIAITDVRVSPTTVTVGDPVSIEVDVLNEGNVDETFDVEVYYDSVLIDTITGVTLSAGAGTTLSFTWDTTGVADGNYTITAEVPAVPGEVDIADNVFIDGVVTVLPPVAVHDVAVISVTVFPTTVAAGDSVSITVVVENQGTETETFGVTVYYDANAIGTQTVTVAPGASETLSFSWDTTGVPEGTYTIKAEADVVPGETDIVDNTFIDGIVTVTLLPVGGFEVPINKLELVAPWIVLALAISVVSMVAVFVKRRKKK